MYKTTDTHYPYGKTDCLTGVMNMYLENETTEESLMEEVGIQTEVLYGELEETGQGERLGAEVRYLVSPADTVCSRVNDNGSLASIRFNPA